MNFLELAQQRYTTKKYNPTQKITNEEIETLKQILQLSPSSINSQPWHFTFVADQEQKSKLAAVSYFNEERINQASHLVVFSVIDDIALFEKQIEQNLPQGAINYYKQFMQPQAEENIKSWLQRYIFLLASFCLLVRLCILIALLWKALKRILMILFCNTTDTKHSLLLL